MAKPESPETAPRAVVYPLAGGLTYLLAAAMSATGLALSLTLARRWSGGKLAL